MSHTLPVRPKLSDADFTKVQELLTGHGLPSSQCLVTAEWWLLELLFKLARQRHAVPWPDPLPGGGWLGVKPPFSRFY